MTPKTVVGTAWGFTLELDGTGLINDLLTEILRRSEYPATYNPQLFARAINSFVLGKSDCMFSMSARTLVDTFPEYGSLDLIDSQTITAQTAYLFSSPARPVISSLEGMWGKEIGMLLGETYDNYYADYGAKWTQVPNRGGQYP